MKTSNKILIAGILVAMVAITIGAYRAKSVLASSIIEASGTRVEKSYDLAPFDKINLRDNISYHLVKGVNQSVKADIDEAWADQLKVSVNGDGYLGFDLEGLGVMDSIKVTIYYTDLSKLTIKNAHCTGEITTDSLEHLYVIDGSELDASLNAEYTYLHIQSGSRAKLKGENAYLMVHAESGSDLNALNLLATNARISTGSGAKVVVNVSNSLDAIAESGSSILYDGDPEIKGSEEGSGGSINKL